MFALLTRLLRTARAFEPSKLIPSTFIFIVPVEIVIRKQWAAMDGVDSP